MKGRNELARVSEQRGPHSLGKVLIGAIDIKQRRNRLRLDVCCGVPAATKSAVSLLKSPHVHQLLAFRQTVAAEYGRNVVVIGARCLALGVED